MSLLWAALITVAVAGAAVAALLVVRRRAPEGGYFTDGDRAAGVFGVLATGFSVLLGLVVFLAFSNYDQARSGAEAEALLLRQQYEVAQLMPPTVRSQLSGELTCYGRAVVFKEWPELSTGGVGDAPNPWGVAMFRTLQGTAPRTASEQSAYDKFLDHTADREEARRDRTHGAIGVIPGPLWIVLFFTSSVILVYMLFFADRSERAVVQAMLIGSVVAVITAMLLLIRFLDDPLDHAYGGLKPVAMERTLRVLDIERRLISHAAPPPCDARGVAVRPS
jgi:hypothetical protein